MKKSVNSSKVKKNYYELITGFSACEILSLNEMRFVRGGVGEGGGGEPIIIIPPIKK